MLFFWILLILGSISIDAAIEALSYVPESVAQVKSHIKRGID